MIQILLGIVFSFVGVTLGVVFWYIFLKPLIEKLDKWSRGGYGGRISSSDLCRIDSGEVERKKAKLLEKK